MKQYRMIRPSPVLEQTSIKRSDAGASRARGPAAFRARLNGSRRPLRRRIAFVAAQAVALWATAAGFRPAEAAQGEAAQGEAGPIRPAAGGVPATNPAPASRPPGRGAFPREGREGRGDSAPRFPSAGEGRGGLAPVVPPPSAADVALLTSADRGDVAGMRAALGRGARLEARSQERPAETPLLRSLNSPAPASAEALVAAGADVNARDAAGASPLHAACCDPDLAGVLLGKGAEVDARDGLGATPLCLAAARGCREGAALLIARGADVNARDRGGWSPAYYAAYGGHLGVSQLLAEKGADLNARADDGRNPLDRVPADRPALANFLRGKGAVYSFLGAIDHGDAGAVRSYLESPAPDSIPGPTPTTGAAAPAGVPGAGAAGAGTTGTTAGGRAGGGVGDAANPLTVLLAERNAVGWTPLHHAASRGYAGITASLLAKGASVEAKDVLGRTPLFVAMQRDPEPREAVRTPLVPPSLGAPEGPATREAGPAPHPNAGPPPAPGAGIDPAESSPAEPKDHRATAALLLAGGADVAARDLAGRTPLYAAASAGSAALVDLLATEGADVNAPDARGGTPLHYAARAGDLGAARLLIAKGADVNAKDRTGRAPLHSLAVSDGSPRRADALAELLLSKGADVSARDLRGKTPLDIAREAENEQLAALLEKKRNSEKNLTPESPKPE